MEPFAHYRFKHYYLKCFFWILLGAFLAAAGIVFVLIPNQLIDGGIVGLSMMASRIFGSQLLPVFLVLFNLPFVLLAYRQIGKHFVILMITAVILFSFALALLNSLPQLFQIDKFEFKADTLEVIILGGFLIGTGVGLIIRHGGSTDGTEIMGILINRKKGFTVGQVILFSNIFIFGLAGIIYWNWHTAFLSLMTYVVATKVMDMVIDGFEDTKSALIIASDPRHLSEVLMQELGIGLTILYGRGGYTGEEREILYVVVERLQLAQLKEIVHREDPQAFIAVESLHEVINGRQGINLNQLSKRSGLPRDIKSVDNT